MSSKGAFKHSNRYAATASKYESVIERPVGPPRGPSKSSGKSGGNKPGPWDGVKPDAKSSGKRRERNEEKNSLLEKDYLAEAREKRERTSSIIGNVRAREDVRSPRENRTRESPRNCPTRVADPRRAPSSTQIFCCIVVLACMYGSYVAYKSYTAKGDNADDVPSRPSATRVDADDDATPRAVKSSFVDAFNPNREETEALTPPSPPPEVFQSPENQARIYEAMETKAKAEHDRDEMLSAIEEPSTRAKVRMFADAAIAGVKVMLVESEIAAVDELSACEAIFEKLHLSGDAARCEVKPKEQPALAKVEVERASSVRAKSNPATSASSSPPSSSSSPERSDDEKDRELAETKAELEKLKAQLREKEKAESRNDKLEKSVKDESKASAASRKKAKKKLRSRRGGLI